MKRVSSRALVKRINRKLRWEDEVLKKARPRTGWSELGDYYVVNFRRNWVAAMDVDIEELGRELGVLRAQEELVGADAVSR